MLLYFAYGSNANLPALHHYLVLNEVDPQEILNPRRAILSGWQIRTNYLMTRLTAATNIEPSPRSRVEGVLMEISPAVHKALRRKEGWPHRYVERAVTVSLPRSRRVAVAFTYMVSDRYRLQLDMPVGEDYRSAILEAARTMGFTQKYQRHLLRLLRTA
jgi:hypothetical protein